MIKKMVFLMLTLCALVIFGGGIAGAFPLYPGTATQAGTLFEDNDLDFLVSWNDTDGNQKASWNEFSRLPDTAGLTQGSLLLAVFEYDYEKNEMVINDGYDLNQAVDELVGISLAQVDYISNGVIYFKQFLNVDMVSFYTGGTTNLLDTVNTDHSLSNAIDSVLDGTFLWSFSIDGDPDTQWKFTPDVDFVGNPLDPASVRAAGRSSVVGSFNVVLNQTAGPDIFTQWHTNNAVIGGDGYADLRTTGQIKGGLGLTSAFATSDFDTEVNPTIPEPTTMSLFGAGLIGLAYISRRRTSN